MNLDEKILEKIQNVEKVLSCTDEELKVVVDARGLLKSYRTILIRLRVAERFCVAAKALAEYKKPLEQVLNSLDAWERVAWGSAFKEEISNEEARSLDNRNATD